MLQQGLEVECRGCASSLCHPTKLKANESVHAAV